jgi:hypothetical protein
MADTLLDEHPWLIAGSGIAHNHRPVNTLLTRKVREFERMPGLRIENWYDN